jgi:glycosyltransferase involved in cell wall biosynthesis
VHDVVAKPARHDVHVLHLSTVHRALDSRIFHREARSLAAAGYRVTIMAQHPAREVCDGVEILPLRTPHSRVDRFVVSPWVVLWRTLREWPDIVHFHDPELTPVGLILKLLGRKVVCDMHEDLPQQILNKEWIPSRLRPILGRVVDALEPLSVRAFNLVVVVPPAVVTRLQRHGVRHVVRIRNLPWPDEFAGPAGALPTPLPVARAADETAPAPSAGPRPLAHDTPGGATVVYGGGIAAIRGAEQMIEAVHRCDPSLGVRLVMAGPCDAQYLKKLRALPGWATTEYLGRLPLTAVPALMSMGQVGLVLFHPVPNHMDAPPTKLFEYMAAGLPVVASNFSPYEPIVSHERCGVLVDPRDIAAITRAIEGLIRNPEDAIAMGKRGQAAVRTTYSWESEARRLVEAYDGVAGI